MTFMTKQASVTIMTQRPYFFQPFINIDHSNLNEERVPANQEFSDFYATMYF